MDLVENLFGSGMINHAISQIIAMCITILLIPRLWITSIFGAVFILIGISVANAFLWDAALFFSIPQNLSTAAIQLFISNGVLFWILVKFLPGIETEGILPAVVAPVVFSIISSVLHQYAGAVDWISVGSSVVDYVVSYKNDMSVEVSHGQ